MKGLSVLGSTLCSVLALLAPWAGHAQGLSPGNVDTSFDPGTGVAGPTGPGLVGAQSNGKVILGGGPAGSFESINGVNVTNLARLNSDGSVDPSFHAVLRTSGPLPARVDHLVVLPDDRILVTGTFDIVNG